MEERESRWVRDARSFLSNQISDSRTVPGAVNMPEMCMGVSPKWRVLPTASSALSIPSLRWVREPTMTCPGPGKEPSRSLTDVWTRRAFSRTPRRRAGSVLLPMVMGAW